MEWSNKNWTSNCAESNIFKKQFYSFEELPLSLLHIIEKESNELIVIWNKTCDIIFVSQSVHRLLGFKQCEIFSLKFSNLILSPCPYELRKKVKNGKDITQFNVKLMTKNKKSSWFDCKIQKVKNIKGNEHLYIGYFESINEQKHLKQVLANSEKMSVAGQLAAGVVHEIRNPLTSIKGFVQLMEAGLEGKQQYYDIMIEEIEKMEAMATELLYIAKPADGEKKDERIKSMVEECLILFSSQAEKNRILLQKELDEDLTFYCNRSQIKQVLINLIKNAIEAIRKNGSIIVRVKRINDEIIMEVIDDGPGIPKEILKHLDEPFFTTKSYGTGLGLMVTKQLIEQHDGELKIKSSEEKGTVFQITFPIK